MQSAGAIGINADGVSLHEGFPNLLRNSVRWKLSSFAYFGEDL